MSARYIVGIDLGTTHCAVAYVDTRVEGARVEVFSLPQLVAAGSVESLPLLPSFVYLPPESEGALALPWDERRAFAVGEFARARGADAPGRVVGSAKSWLSHGGVDRRSSLLPLGAPEDVAKISPVEASRRLLEHVREAWDVRFAASDTEGRLAHQEIVLTVPASFDAGARELTVEAARLAGLDRVTLLEEPQAALYSWIEAKGERWRKDVRVGDVLLVVDVGGGTTDFSAMACVDREGTLELVRIAVGEHILLGGDNMDLALAHGVRQKFEGEGRTLDLWQMVALTHACRKAKEALLSDPSLDSTPIALVGRGSKLFGNTLRTELRRSEVTAMLVDGFFPRVPKAARPGQRARSALTQLGLPYASDAAVTKHLAQFLGRQIGALEDVGGAGATGAARGSFLHPTAVLFNGGVMKAEVLRDRVFATLDDWLAEDGATAARILEGGDLDLAVARGAAAYGLARRGRGLRIRGGTARSYYVGIEGAVPAVPGLEPPVSALCLAPMGMEEGTQAQLPPHELGAVVGEPVRFRFFGSTVRRSDGAGTELDHWGEGELEELPPIEITLASEGRRAGDVVPVRLQAAVTEVGTLKVEAVPLHPLSIDERWKVEFSVRSEE